MHVFRLFSVPLGIVLLVSASSVSASEEAALDYETWMQLGRTHARQREYTEAVNAYEHAVRENPTIADGWRELARTRERLDQWEGAIEAYRQVEAIGGVYHAAPIQVQEPAETDYSIAKCYARMGNEAAAFESIEQSLKNGLRHPDRLLREPAFRRFENRKRLERLSGYFDPTTMSRDEGYRADLRLLAREMFRLHPQPYQEHSRFFFELRIQAIDAAIPRLTESQIQIEFARLVRLLGDGHSHVRFPNVHLLPIRFFWFDEGIFVSSTLPGYREWLGMRLVEVAGHAIDDVLAEFDSITPRDNEMSRKNFLCRSLGVIELYAGLGLSEDSSQLNVVFQDRDGARHDATFEGLLEDDLNRRSGEWADLKNAEGEVPVSWRDPGKPLWFEPMNNGRTVYASVAAMTNIPDESFQDFSERLFDFVDQNGTDCLIVDFRQNGGGNTFLNRTLIDRMIRSQINQRGKLFVLIGRRTFSAAQNTVTTIEQWTDAILVGEPTGSRPNVVGETVPFDLPFSRVRVNISDLYWQTSTPLDRRKWLAPEIYVPERIADVQSRRDAALDAIANYRKAHGDAVPVTSLSSR